MLSPSDWKRSFAFFLFVVAALLVLGAVTGRADGRVIGLCSAFDGVERIDVALDGQRHAFTDRALVDALLNWQGMDNWSDARETFVHSLDESLLQIRLEPGGYLQTYISHDAPDEVVVAGFDSYETVHPCVAFMLPRSVLDGWLTEVSASVQPETGGYIIVGGRIYR